MASIRVIDVQIDDKNIHIDCESPHEIAGMQSAYHINCRKKGIICFTITVSRSLPVNMRSRGFAILSDCIPPTANIPTDFARGILMIYDQVRRIAESPARLNRIDIYYELGCRRTE